MSVEAFERASERAGCEWAIETISGADHRLSVDGVLADGYLELMTEWIEKRDPRTLK